MKAPMTGTVGTAEASGVRVLLFTPDPTTGRSYVQALEEATIAVEWVQTVAELDALTVRPDRPSPSLVMVVPSQQEMLDPGAFAELAIRLSSGTAVEAQHHLASAPTSPASSTEGRRNHLQGAFRAYCSLRALSPRQEQVLELYLVGKNDKEMAQLFGCSEATVYEHWRRMARKAAGIHKWDVVTDFHRFLAGNTSGDAKTGSGQAVACPVPGLRAQVTVP